MSIFGSYSPCNASRRAADRKQVLSAHSAAASGLHGRRGGIAAAPLIA